MSTNTTAANSSYDDGRIDELINRIDELEQQNQQQQRQLDKQEDTIQQQQKKIEDLQQQLDNEVDRRSAEIEGVHNRISNVEEASNGGGDGSTPSDPKGVDDNTTPLEQVVRLPEATANSSLSNNQRRARFVAADINDYAKRCTAGRTLSSSDIATILKSGTDCKGRTQTVARVMEFLDKLGGNNVKIVKRRGTKRVVFDEEYADRLSNVEPNNGCRYDNTAVAVI